MFIAELASHKHATFNGTPKHARKEKQESNAQTKESKPRRQLMRRPSIQRILLHGNPFCGSNEKVKIGKFISITPCVGTAARGGLRAPQWKAATQKRGQYFNTMAATGMDAQGVTQENAIESSPAAKKTKNRKQLYQKAVQRTRVFRAACYPVIEVWECDIACKQDAELLHSSKQQKRSYPHAILYDFEAYGEKNRRKEPTGMLTFENIRVPISVTVGDTLEREPTHICERDPA